MTGRTRWTRLAAVVAAALLVAACSSGDEPTSGSSIAHPDRGRRDHLGGGAAQWRAHPGAGRQRLHRRGGAGVRAGADRVGAVQRSGRRRHARGAGRLREPGGRAVRAVPRPVQRTRPGEQDRHVAREPRRAGLRWHRSCAQRVAEVRRAAAPAVRHHRLGPSRHRRERPADRLHRQLRPVLHGCRLHAGRRCAARRCRGPRRAVRERLHRAHRVGAAVRGHQQQRARHRHHPARARGADDLVLRAQLRQRARHHLGDVVSRHGPRCGGRRCGRPERRGHRLECPAAAGFRGRAHGVPRPVRRRRCVRVPQRGRRGRCLRCADGEPRRGADRRRPRPAAGEPRHRPHRRVDQRCIRRTSGRRSPSRSPQRRRAMAAGCSRCSTPTTAARPMARGGTSSRRSR